MKRWYEFTFRRNGEQSDRKKKFPAANLGFAMQRLQREEQIPEDNISNIRIWNE